MMSCLYANISINYFMSFTITNVSIVVVSLFERHCASLQYIINIYSSSSIVPPRIKSLFHLPTTASHSDTTNYKYMDCYPPYRPHYMTHTHTSPSKLKTARQLTSPFHRTIHMLQLIHHHLHPFHVLTKSHPPSHSRTTTQYTAL